ncbi:hypothetical protein FB563_7937 [Streptomyces puniciscabiei]|uniref:Uncharacterized protein n=1 Tax=Streptomyces puniciscabiei TaxID=164348 RepID=A0A542SYJ9_9ACTN|nr:hypothetical protein [Streptomyces puniciscabiei]TQK79598.1 hypothetical protein FB563_7937 [Streptomyces puniciscabiei]
MLPSTAHGDSRLSMWLRVRTYAVPPSMIELATRRRAAGDWAGACAAARIDVDLDLRSAARAHGREIAARLRADLRRLAPDLLRWHMPRIAPDGLLRPGLTLTLARYERPGRAGPLHLVARTPPAWADAGQRIGLALFDPADPPAGRHPHPHPHRRYRLDLHRHLWDASRSGELRARSGAVGPAPPDLDPLGLLPPGSGCAVGRWPAEADLLLRAEGHSGGPFAVRLGGGRRLLLAVTADGGDAPEPIRQRRRTDPADGAPGPGGVRHRGAPHQVGDVPDPAENGCGAGPAEGAPGLARIRHRGRARHIGGGGDAPDAAEFLGGACPDEAAPVPGRVRHPGQARHVGGGGDAPDAARFPRGAGADGVPGPAGLPYQVAGRDGAPRLRIVDEVPPGGRSAVPVLPDAATWVTPDLELLRAGLIGADRLHPLVAAALVPGHPAPGALRDPDPVDRARRVECGGATHRIGLVDGVLVPLDHHPDEIRREELLAALGGPPLPCLRVIDEAHRRPDCLAGVRERLDHGDTEGALAVVEGLLGPGAVLREGPLRDELTAAAERRIAYGLYRAGLTDPGETSPHPSRRTGRGRRPTRRQARPVTFF